MTFLAFWLVKIPLRNRNSWGHLIWPISVKTNFLGLIKFTMTNFERIRKKDNFCKLFLFNYIFGVKRQFLVQKSFLQIHLFAKIIGLLDWFRHNQTTNLDCPKTPGPEKEKLRQGSTIGVQFILQKSLFQKNYLTIWKNISSYENQRVFSFLKKVFWI